MRATILQPLDLLDFRFVPITDASDIETVLHCPADGTVLKVIAGMSGRDPHIKIRVGGCSLCGYIGYIDRPGREWMDSFYSSGDWDLAKVRDGNAFVEGTIKPNMTVKM